MDSALQKRQLKTEQIANLLEGYMGRPTQSKRLPPPLHMLIATLLSQNTNDRNSYQAWMNLRRTYPTWKQVSKAPLRQLAKVIEVGGLKNQKAKRIKMILKSVKNDTGTYSLGNLRKKSDDEIIDYLTSFEGIGKKTAACVLVFSLGRDVFPVDTHVHRLCNRMGLVKTKLPDHTFLDMRDLVPRGRAYSFHTNLIPFGRKICRAREPLCGICPVYQDCTYVKKKDFASQDGAQLSQRDVNFMLLDHVH